MSWGSFLIGSVCGAALASLVCAVHGKTVQFHAVSTERLVRLVLARLHSNESLHFDMTIVHGTNPPDDDDDETCPENYSPPEKEDAFWRKN